MAKYILLFFGIIILAVFIVPVVVGAGTDIGGASNSMFGG